MSSSSVARGRSIHISSEKISDTLIIQVVSILAFLALWETVSRTGIIFRELVPSLFTVAEHVATLLASDEFWPNLFITLYEIALGFALAAVIGVGLGLFLGARVFWGDVFEPVALCLAATPKIIFFPLCLMFFGLDEGSKLAIGALSGVFPILISTITGAREVNPILLRVARSLRARPFHIYWKVYVPSVLRHIFAGLRLGLGVTIIGALLGEIKVSRGGLGFMAINFYGQYNLASMYAVIVIIFLLAGGVNGVMGILLARFSRYRSTLKT